MTPRKKLRIVRIVARLNVGGPARHVTLLTESFRTKGWYSELVVGEVADTEGSMEGFAASRQIHPIKIPELGRELHFFRDIKTLYKVLCLLYRLKPDIVHTHTAKAGAVGRLAAFLYRRGHWRGFWAPRPLLIYHTFHGHVLRGYFSPFKEWVFRRIEKFLAGISTNLITLSPALRRELVEMGIAPACMVVIVPLGLELDPFGDRNAKTPGRNSLCRELGLPEDVPLVGIVGRLVPIKDHATFLRAVSILVKNAKSDHRAASAHFVIVGDGELREKLEAHAAELNIMDRCHFIGWRDDLPEIYESLEIVALTSLNEGTPVCLIEGMAAARPIVATRVGGVADLTGEAESGSSGHEISDGDFKAVSVGVLTRPEDPGGFSRAIAYLLEDKERSAGLGQAGRARVRDRYSVGRLVEDLTDLYVKGHEESGNKA